MDFKSILPPLKNVKISTKNNHLKYCSLQQKTFQTKQKIIFNLEEIKR